MDLPNTTAFVSGASRGLGQLDEASPEQAQAVLTPLSAPPARPTAGSGSPAYARRALEPLGPAS